MSHCATNFAWYLGKFIIGFTGMLFLYVFLKENEKSCVCDARTRELLRQKNEKRPGRCECARGMRNEYYPCGCNKPKRLMQDDGVVLATATEHIKDNCARNCTRRNSH